MKYLVFKLFSLAIGLLFIFPMFAIAQSNEQYDFSMEDYSEEISGNSSAKDNMSENDSGSLDSNIPMLKINDINTTYNRNVYKFTSYFLQEILSPVIIIYKENIPKPVENALLNFFSNMNELSYALNHILQGDPIDFSTSIVRFAINSTVGILGFVDVSEMMGMSKQKTNMSDTLVSWGIPAGPFVMLPLMGGGTVRSFAGEIIDFFTDPFYWFVLPPLIPDLGWRAVFSISKSAVYGFLLVADNYVYLVDLEKSSIDPYSTFRNFYLQNKYYKVMQRQKRRNMNREQLMKEFFTREKESGYKQLSVTETPENHYSSESISNPMDFSMETETDDKISKQP